MEENKTVEVAQVATPEEESSAINFGLIYRTLVLNWKWFVLSVIICLGLAFVYLRYATPVYQAYAKLLIKDNDQQSGSNRTSALLNSQTLGLISNSTGIDNEMEILTSHSLAEQAVRDLKLYTTYYSVGKVKANLMYKDQYISVDMDPAHLEHLNAPVSLEIQRMGNKYHVTGSYYVPVNENSADGPYEIDKTISQLPATIGTKAGILSFTNNSVVPMVDGSKMKVVMLSPKQASYKYVGALSVSQTSKTTTIAQLTLKDEDPQRAVDYLQQLAICYNRQANEDKNEIAMRTEEFINGRLEKINAELGNTEGALENYKRRNNMVELKMNAGQAVTNADQYAQRLSEANTQVALLDEMRSYINNPSNKYQPLPSNVGLSDQSSTTLINSYNELVQRRNLLLQSASETSPSVLPLTQQLDDLDRAIKRALNQARRSMDIQRNSVASQYGNYQGQVGETPEQERMLTQIGRQQEVKSGLYLMLLQKREETSMSLASTADKAKIIEPAAFVDKVSPKGIIALLIAFILGVAIPAGIIYLRELLRSKILGHDDVEKLTQLPIIGDIPTASANGSKGNIVIQENKSNLMSEIFRGLRTNLQLAGDDKEKVFIVTSTTTGEGKTFIASNLAMSLALLEKKTIMVGLDIRKPRMAELFSIGDRQHGITNILANEECNWEEVKAQIVASGVNHNLDLLTAGPTPANPGELMVRKSLKQTIALLKEHYDYVIIDTAPVGLVADTLQLSKLADRTLFVCRADFSTKSSFTYINKLDEQKKLPNISIVINDIDLSKKKFAYSYGFGKYSKNGNRSFGFYGLFSNNTNDDSIKI